jgi:hypothetical protein
MDYTNDPAVKSRDLTRWLIKNLGLSEFPRIAVSLSPKLVVALDFRVLRKEDPKRLLLVLRDHWDHYSDMFLNSDCSSYGEEEAKANLRAALAAMEVPCAGGYVRPLCQTTLPTADIASGALEAASFIELPEAEDPRWHFLSHFGVIINPGIEQFVQYLRHVKHIGGSFDQIRAVYIQLQALAGEDLLKLR